MHKSVKVNSNARRIFSKGISCRFAYPIGLFIICCRLESILIKLITVQLSNCIKIEINFRPIPHGKIFQTQVVDINVVCILCYVPVFVRLAVFTESDNIQHKLLVVYLTTLSVAQTI
jgi:hypothetical protein